MSEEIKKLEKQIESAKALGCVNEARYLTSKLEVMKKEVVTVIESYCIDCDWKGAESEHHFLDGWHVLPNVPPSRVFSLW